MRSRFVVISVCLFLAAAAFSVAVPANGQDPEPDLITLSLRQVSVGPPTMVGSLAVFPLFSNGEFPDGTEVETLDRALASDSITIREMPGGMDQRYLMASNRGGGSVFGQGGGYLGGGGQSRGGGGSFYMASLDSGAMPVLCFEEGRTTGETPFFDASSYTLAHPTLRGLAATGNQDMVWREIMRYRQVLSGPGPVHIADTSYGSCLGFPAVSQAVDFFSQSAPTVGRSAHGVLVACGDRVLGIDLYGDASLFAASRDSVLTSYAMVNAELGPAVPCHVTQRGVSQFLEDMAASARIPREPIFRGEGVGLSCGPHVGEALAVDGTLVYLGAHDTRPPSMR